MTKYTRNNEISNLIANYTTNAITAHTYDFSECNALDISEVLNLNRANVSRILNRLYQDRKLIKIQGRPTLYIDSKTINSFTDEPVPSIIPLGKDIKDYLLAKHIKNKRELPISSQIENKYIGVSHFESLYSINKKVIAGLYYPTSIFCLGFLYKPGSGLSDYLFDLFNFSKKMQLIDEECLFLKIDYSSKLDRKDIISSVKKTGFVVVDVHGAGIEELQSLHKELLKKLNTLSKKAPDSKKNVLIYKIDNHEDYDYSDFIVKYLDQNLNFPEYSSRTIKERIEIILENFQEQANSINETICIDKNILNCFATAEMKHGLHELVFEIRASIMKGYYDFISSKNKTVEITFDNLSDELLNNIHDVSKYLPQINNIFSSFETDILYFIPQSECTFLNNLKKSELNSELLIENTGVTQILEICRNMLDNVSKVQINTLRSIYVKEIYDILYPILSRTPLSKDENYLIVLFEFIQNVLDDLQKGSYTPKYSNYSVPCNQMSIHLTETISEVIHHKTSVQLPTFEQKVINAYLFMVLNKYTHEVPILILCHGEDIATNYVRYVKNSKLYDKIEAVNYTEEWRQKSFQEFVNHVYEKVFQLGDVDNIMIFADISPLTEIGEYISRKIDIKIKTIAPLSLPLILDTISKLNNGMAINDTSIVSNDLAFSSNENFAENSQILINKIANNILDQSLIFLNPKKTTVLLLSVLLEVLKKLKINYTDEIAIRFIIHGAFVIERAIRNESITNKKVKEIVNQNPLIFNTLKDELETINNTFTIQITDSEIATFTLIFLDFV